MRVAVIYDGTSYPLIDSVLRDALDISKDVKEIVAILHGQGMEVVAVPLYAPLDQMLHQLRELKMDLIFNLFEGFGDDSASEYQVASLLEWMKIPYTGSGPMSLALCHNKAIANGLLQFSNIPAPLCRVIQKGEKLEDFNIEFPVIVKPIHEDGSIGIDTQSVTWTLEMLNQRAKRIHQEFNQAAIAEKYIDGREFNVSLVGNDKLDFTQVREIEYLNMEGPRILTYNAKWNQTSLEYQNTLPRKIVLDHEPFLALIKQLSVECFKLFKIRDYGRIDFRLGEDEVPYVIDVNPNPCISRDSGLAHAALLNQLSYEKLIQRIVDHALQRSC